MRDSEGSLQTKLKQQELENGHLKTRMDNLQKRFNEEKEQSNALEAVLRDQLTQRDQECASLQRQLRELEKKIQCLCETEQRLQSQIKAAHQRELKATRLREEAEKEYWDLHNEIEQIIERNVDVSVDSECSSSLPPPPATWLKEHPSVLDHNNPNPPLLSFHSPTSYDTRSIGYRQETCGQIGTSGGSAMIQPATMPSAANVITVCQELVCHTLNL